MKHNRPSESDQPIGVWNVTNEEETHTESEPGTFVRREARRGSKTYPLDNIPCFLYHPCLLPGCSPHSFR